MKKPPKPGDKRDTRESRKPSFDVEADCTFQDLPAGDELQAACLYEYMRESQTLRTRIAEPGGPAGKVGLRIAGWEFTDYGRLYSTLEVTSFPKPWKKLEAEARTNLVEALTELIRKTPEIHPPLVITELQVLPTFYSKDDPQNIKWQTPGPVVFGSVHEQFAFFGSISIDDAYNEGEAVEAFRKWYAEKYAKRKGGGSLGHKSKLNDLSALRVRHCEGNRARRFELLFKATGMKSYDTKEKRSKLRPTDSLRDVAASRSPHAKGMVEFIGGIVRPPDSNPTGTADAVLHRSCVSAVAFFKTLFPAETPLSAAPFSIGES